MTFPEGYPVSPIVDREHSHFTGMEVPVNYFAGEGGVVETIPPDMASASGEHYGERLGLPYHPVGQEAHLGFMVAGIFFGYDKQL